MKNVKKFLEQKVRDCNIFVIHEENLKIDIEDVTILKPPIILKDFINQIYKICKKNENLKNLVKLKNLQFNLKNNELIFDGTKKNKTYRIRE